MMLLPASRQLRRWGVIAVLLLILVAIGCDRNKPIKIGFVGGLTGRFSDLGTSARNGVILAVEEINRKGGINGRQVELVVRDDQQDPEIAVKVDRELIREKVVAIIGHETSAMSVAATPLINDKKMLMLSPTTATNQLSGIDDYFFRVLSASASAIDFFAEYAYQFHELRQLAVVYDQSNEAFSEEWFTRFRTIYNRNGGVIVAVPFTPGPQTNFADLARQVQEASVDGVLLVANPLDSAMLAQHLRMINSEAVLLATMWAMEESFISQAGPAAEGVVFCHWYIHEPVDDHDRQFHEAFTARFSSAMNFGAHFGYEAASVLFQALAVNPDPAALKQTILAKKTFQGLHDEIIFDSNGDTFRKVYLMTVRNGRFESLMQ